MRYGRMVGPVTLHKEAQAVSEKCAFWQPSLRFVKRGVFLETVQTGSDRCSLMSVVEGKVHEDHRRKVVMEY